MNLSKISSFLRRFDIEIILFLSLILVSFRLDLNWFNTHMSRDLLRARLWSLGTPTDWFGPEIGWDYKRLPGPAYYWFLVPLIMLQSIEAMVLVKILLLWGSVWALAHEIKIQFPKVALNFLLLFCLMPMFVFSSRNMWNPSNIVMFNCLQLFYFLKMVRTRQIRWSGLSVITALISLQFHFSTLMIFTSLVLAGLFSNSFSPQQKKILGAGGLFTALWLLAWYFVNRVPQFDEQLANYYGLSNHYFINRFDDLRSLLSFVPLQIGDYDLFSLYWQSLAELEIVNTRVLEAFLWAFNFLLVICSFVGLYRIKNDWRLSKNPVFIFIFIQIFLFLISVFVLKNKANVPYRYLICLYPVQFFILAYGFKDSRWFRGLCGIVFLTYFGLNSAFLYAYEITGRAPHTNNDNLEISLKNKEQLYGFLQKQTAPGSDPFIALHGRAANKFRLKEMDWAQTTPYFSLYRLQTGREVVYDYNNQSFPEKSWLLHLKNLKELKENSAPPYTLTPLAGNDLPKDVSLWYFDNENNLIKQLDWPVGALIMPMAYITGSKPPEKIVLKFTVPGKRILNLLSDSNDDYFGYVANYHIKDVKINGQSAQAVRDYSGFFLVQMQDLYQLPDTERVSVEITLDVIYKLKNYTRIDIYLTDTIQDPEELFIKTEYKQSTKKPRKSEQ